ncbi:MAG TPA: FAD:protein FMN transferase, partial [Gaiellaceae bacterium]
VGTIKLTSGGVATSGPARRRFGPNGMHHHLIDPTTGESAEHGPLAVTVVASDPIDADAHATALAVSANVDEYMSARPALGALVVDGLDLPRHLGAIDFLIRPVSFEVTL